MTIQTGFHPVWIDFQNRFCESDDGSTRAQRKTCRGARIGFGILASRFNWRCRDSDRRIADHRHHQRGEVRFVKWKTILWHSSRVPIDDAIPALESAGIMARIDQTDSTTGWARGWRIMVPKRDWIVAHSIIDRKVGAR